MGSGRGREDESEKLEIQSTLKQALFLHDNISIRFVLLTFVFQMLKAGGQDVEMAQLLVKLSEKFADYGRERRVCVEYHIEQLEKLLLPTTTTKMGLWTLHQDNDFYTVDGQVVVLRHRLKPRSLHMKWFFAHHPIFHF